MMQRATSCGKRSAATSATLARSARPARGVSGIRIHAKSSNNEVNSDGDSVRGALTNAPCLLSSSSTA